MRLLLLWDEQQCQRRCSVGMASLMKAGTSSRRVALLLRACRPIARAHDSGASVAIEPITDQKGKAQGSSAATLVLEE